MPLITHSSYKAPKGFRNPHLSTIYPSTFRRVQGVTYVRERLELTDGDFLDLDWSYATGDHLDNTLISSTKRPLAIISHGYLGNTTRHYVLGGVKSFNLAGYDTLAWNHRGLGGTCNRLEKITTHGSTDELKEIISYALTRGYTFLILVGYSKGGNQILKYAGELGAALPKAIEAMVAISTPTDMAGSMAVCRGTFYEWYFMRKLRKFMATRQHLIPPTQYAEFARYRTLDDFTNEYVSPLLGWKNYAEATSALPFVEHIQVPTLLLNAQNDPILSPSCSPEALARKSDYLWLETPQMGGHCGFYEKTTDGLCWADRRSVEFVSQLIYSR
ncbi:hypothetical protein BWI96_04665 [Siphonobacter sp. SORGH_AS_0500]|uniref:YheT family hydrolase n=1 Tax=Siphonobacter sp. SORGH_AS_0500 TaxID=1864824 RepID=UPI000CB62AD3|nr:alpha/beta fold hydrolase [Siphonobacter sp. SORGH_AS_0500]PKK37763.1 hypothetical protein BWI96_04665 [Siphonobacter sp. SORGH_AS_0500]